MTRISLKEAYDNKDVIAQIYAIRDTAESAVDTSEQAVTTANTASEHVDALVPQVEGAIENANSASASAQASAQTVAGYENRLATAESDIDGLESDLNAVTLRVQTAEGAIVTIQGRVTALETADGQNVKINRINDYAVGLTGNQPVITGTKTFTSYLSIVQKATNIDTTTKPNANQFKPILLLRDMNDQDLVIMNYFNPASSADGVDFDIVSNNKRARLHIVIDPDGGSLMQFITAKGTVTLADTRGA